MYYALIALYSPIDKSKHNEAWWGVRIADGKQRPAKKNLALQPQREWVVMVVLQGVGGGGGGGSSESAKGSSVALPNR